MLLCTKNRILLLDDKIRQWTMDQDRIQFKQWKGRYYHRMKYGSGWSFPTQYKEMIETYYEMNRALSLMGQDAEEEEEEKEREEEEEEHHLIPNPLPEENRTTTSIEGEPLLPVVETTTTQSLSSSVPVINAFTNTNRTSISPTHLSYKYDVPMEMRMHFQRMYGFPPPFYSTCIQK